jgi:acyl carrier protein
MIKELLIAYLKDLHPVSYALSHTYFAHMPFNHGTSYRITVGKPYDVESIGTNTCVVVSHQDLLIWLFISLQANKELLNNLVLTNNLKLKMERSQIDSIIKGIIVEKLAVDEDEVKPEAHIVDDIGADSLDHTELIMDVEKAFGISIPDELAENLLTPKAFGDYVEGHIN